MSIIFTCSIATRAFIDATRDYVGFQRWFWGNLLLKLMEAKDVWLHYPKIFF